MPTEVWVSPLGNYELITVTPEGGVKETRKEWLRRMGFADEDRYRTDETPEEKAERIAKAVAENEQFFAEQGWVLSDEKKADLDALFDQMDLISRSIESEET